MNLNLALVVSDDIFCGVEDGFVLFVEFLESQKRPYLISKNLTFFVSSSKFEI